MYVMVCNGMYVCMYGMYVMVCFDMLWYALFACMYECNVMLFNVM